MYWQWMKYILESSIYHRFCQITKNLAIAICIFHFQPNVIFQDFNWWSYWKFIMSFKMSLKFWKFHMRKLVIYLKSLVKDFWFTAILVLPILKSTIYLGYLTLGNTHKIPAKKRESWLEVGKDSHFLTSFVYSRLRF